MSENKLWLIPPAGTLEGEEIEIALPDEYRLSERPLNELLQELLIQIKDKGFTFELPRGNALFIPAAILKNCIFSLRCKEEKISIPQVGKEWCK